MTGKKLPDDKHYVTAARAQHQNDGEVEIDDGAPVSRADDNPDGGAYVQAWVWVYDGEARAAEKGES